MKTAIVTVTNDLTTDQRVHRTCTALAGMGYGVVLIGRRLRNSQVLAPREYVTDRMRLLFDKGPWFYAEYNIRLFFRLLFAKAALIVTNDLDTLPAGWLASAVRRIPLLHDCHEYFRGMPELAGRPGVTRFWKFLEDLIFPRLKNIVAVNESVAELYRQEYKVAVQVARNVPFRKDRTSDLQKREIGIPPERKVILYQGAVNVGRGLEEVILAMKILRHDAVFVIAGIGDISAKLHEMVREEGLTRKVLFLGQVPFQSLHQYTCMADIGLSVEKEEGINYQNCLPNKFLDYIQARVPVLVTPFPEMKQIVDKYRIGEFISSHDPGHIAQRIDAMLGNEAALDGYRKNLGQAARDLCWENESSVITNLVSNIR
jgi:glycosyltransferase involved in cell wall biosynthesis